MAYDPQAAEPVLFGGLGADGTLADTWTWNGTTWTAGSTPAGPPARQGASATYDQAAGGVVLFGGSSDAGTAGGGATTVSGNSSSVMADTWAWDATGWSEATASPGPPARSGASMAYDAAARDVVLFGGEATGPLDDTWTWSATTAGNAGGEPASSSTTTSSSSTTSSTAVAPTTSTSVPKGSGARRGPGSAAGGHSAGAPATATATANGANGPSTVSAAPGTAILVALPASGIDTGATVDGPPGVVFSDVNVFLGPGGADTVVAVLTVAPDASAANGLPLSVSDGTTGGSQVAGSLSIT